MESLEGVGVLHLNLVITETGAGEGSRSEVLPELKGKLTANAIRVPTPNVSLSNYET